MAEIGASPSAVKALTSKATAADRADVQGHDNDAWKRPFVHWNGWQ